MRMKHGGDPAKELMEKVGDLSSISIFGPKVLVAIYLRPNVTAGGIFLTDKAIDEDLYQGKIGLVIKTGPTAFQDSGWFQQGVNVGDWVWFRASNGIAMKFNGVDCRFMEDVRIEGKVTEPDKIW